MKKMLSFIAGLVSGSIVGGTAALLMAPMSGPQLRSEAEARWEAALSEARQAMEQTQQQKELEFQMMKEAGEIR